VRIKNGCPFRAAEKEEGKRRQMQLLIVFSWMAAATITIYLVMIDVESCCFDLKNG
jgi:hypothetical protein